MRYTVYRILVCLRTKIRMISSLRNFSVRILDADLFTIVKFQILDIKSNYLPVIVQYASHGIDFFRCFLMPRSSYVACSTGVRLIDLVSMGPAVTVVVCSSCRSLALPYRLNLDFECRNLALELCDESLIMMFI
jgi:hypothetical protein